MKCLLENCISNMKWQIPLISINQLRRLGGVKICSMAEIHKWPLYLSEDYKV